MKEPRKPCDGHSKKRRKAFPGGIFGRRAGIPQGWENVAYAPDRLAAGLLESALEAEGIPVIIHGPPGVAWLGIGGMHGVMVPEDRVPEAREILSVIWDVREPGPEDD